MQTVAVCCCLVPRPHYSARPVRFGSCGPGASWDTPPYALTERAWEDSTVELEKNRDIVIG